jgi:flavin reductase (DIM6/NTAB) family NADH-FMN oxidoreductase RutF
MNIEPAEFRRVLGHFATGVTVITTQHQNQLHGTTVSSFCSLSLDPPLVLVCLDRQATIHDLVIASGTFGVNILAEHGEKTSRHFARRAPDKFSEITYGLGQLDVPLLEDALATLECRVVERHPGGDHSIVIGEVVAINAQAHAHPLLFFRSKYSRLHSDASVLTSSAPTAAQLVKHPTNVSALANGTARD